MKNSKRIVGLTCVVLATIAGLLLLLVRVESSFPPPVQVSITRSNAALRVFPGVTGVFFILPDGSLWCWGQTGGGQFPRARMPVQVGTNMDWAQAFAANNHCLGLKQDGTVWEWGWRGQRTTSTPEQAAPGTNWIGIAAGDVHSVALRRDGTLWAWGDNSNHQLGSDGPNRTEAEQVGDDNDWMDVSSGFGSMTYALKKDGTFWAWGYDYNTTVFAQPTRVLTETNWVGFEPGPLSNVRNRAGELWRPRLFRPGLPQNASTVCLRLSTNSFSGHCESAYAGKPSAFEVRPDGTLWEAPLTYQLSSATAQVQLLQGAWHQVGKRSDWVGVWGAGTAIGLTADGTLWGWGVDPGLEPRMDFASRCRWIENRITSLFGLGSGNLSTSSTPQYRKTPAPIMKLRFNEKP